MSRTSAILLTLVAVAVLGVILVQTLGPSSDGVGPEAPDPANGSDPGGDDPPSLPDPGDPGDGPLPGGATGSLLVHVRLAGSESPVRGVIVEAVAGRWRGTADTDGEGAARIEQAPAGGVRVRVSSRSHLEPPWRNAVVEPEEETELTILLGRGVVLTGTVTDSATDAPIGGVTVRHLESTAKTAVTDSRGAYLLEGLAAGNARLVAFGPEYPARRLTVGVPPDEDTWTFDFVLTKGATVSGTVTTTAGEPIGGAVVACTGMSRDMAGEVKTAADGRFRIRGVPATRTVTLTARHDGYAPGQSDAMRLTSGEQVDGVEIRLARGGGIRGRVFLDDGTPAAGARLNCWATKYRGRTGPLPRAQAAEDGSFELTPLAPGDYRVVASLTGHLSAQENVSGVEEGRWVEGVALRLGAANGIAGFVRDGTGAGVAGARVFARPVQPRGTSGWGNATTARDGSFLVKGLGEGVYRISVRSGAGGAEETSVEVEAGARDVVVVVPTPGGIAGRVVAERGTPLANVRVYAVLTDGGPRGRRVAVPVDPEDGTFRFTGLPPGTFEVYAGTNAAFSESRDDVAVVAGQETGGLLLLLRPAASIRCRVCDTDGRTLAGARVVARALDGFRTGGWATGTTGGDGVFLAAGLRPGRYRVDVTAEGMSAGVTDVEAGSGVQVDLTVRMPGRGRLTVRVVDGEGRPLAGALIHLRTASGRYVSIRAPEIDPSLPPEERARAQRDASLRSLRTDEAGVSVREGVPEGTLAVRAMLSGYGDGSTTVEVRDGGAAEVTVTLTPGASSLDRKRGEPDRRDSADPLDRGGR